MVHKQTYAHCSITRLDVISPGAELRYYYYCPLIVMTTGMGGDHKEANGYKTISKYKQDFPG